jgi:hypothetical protein
MANGITVKTVSGVTDSCHGFKLLAPQFDVKWSRDWVVPDNELQPGDAEAELVVDSVTPKNRPTAAIVMQQVWDGGAVPGVNLSPLALRAAQVVAAGGMRPVQLFGFENKIWDRFDKLDYHFDCTIEGVKKSTPAPLKVKRWHVQALDSSDDDAAVPDNIYRGFRLTEGADFMAAFAASADDVAHTWTFDAGSTGFAGFGEKMKNSFTFVYTGHGVVTCRRCQNAWVSRAGMVHDPAEVAAGVPAPTGSDAEFGAWTTCATVGCSGSPRSTHCIGGWQPAGSDSFMDASHVADAAICPTTPKYLMFSVCCGGAFETSLFDAYIGRGTRYGVGFKKSTRCDWARDYAKSFFETWAQTHQCDPQKIPDVFNGLQATWKTKLAPSLFGQYAGIGSSLRNFGRALANAL